MPELILASTSPYRRRMLTDAGLAVRAESPGVDERAVTSTDPVALARALARRKATAVADRLPESLVLGADQVAWDPRAPHAPFGKPLDAEDHFRRLRAMVGHEHVLVTGYALIGPGVDIVGSVSTTLHFRPDIEDDELRAYVATGEGSGCCGGYAVEGRGGFLVAKIDGDYTNVLGLPMPDVLGALRGLGWRFAPGGRFA